MTKTRAETDSTKHRLAWALIMLGALLMALGAWRGEVAVVLQKAIRICLECIGIG
ncbi:MAG TPA: CD1871A family CXXC motif-containing protein [Clostridia bacterium]|jgi:hypothetical protein|nr:CD1871A family CXXC motif-containing protein [Clostridia bacterium]HPA61636.1 CD1871A family CXXC motif-containing protein [Clostridia bacterium]HPY93823.1 CD1871A family CXXC motif-containing protein [Clostridia bacterium]HQO55918.1 CD1871A family CXXC motif-containing protein [Clostridia bacterium]HUM60430.1 CD1871A family CXXC motif-containing protein [Clostridia bacterium]